MSKDKLHSKYLWIDLEMTGLDVKKERIIEVGAIITDVQLNELDEFHCIVFQPQDLLNQMDEWNQKHHQQSGLLSKIPAGLKESDAEKELLNWSLKHFSEEEKIVLAGNTIYQDRLFLEKYFISFSKLLHYRQLDVTSWKLPFLTKGITYEKQNTHRALDDIKESIAEFKFLWNHKTQS